MEMKDKKVGTKHNPTESAALKRLEHDLIKEDGIVPATKGRHAIHCLTVIGTIEGHTLASDAQKTTKYEHVIPQLVDIEEDPEIEGLLVILNTVGGDVEAGLALAELIAGVSKPSLAKLGGTVACFMADGDVARAAQENGTTRADAAMEKAAREYPGAVLAVGNAPTALLRLEALIADGLRPALVVAVPVGFVNVVESKERIFAACRAADVPAIASMGRKGGSNVAAAICNALLYTAVDALDPARRGWQG